MATVRMPSSLHAQMTRRAISPRFAISIFLNIRDSSVRTAASAVQPGTARLSLRLLRREKAREGARLIVHQKGGSHHASLFRPDGEQLLAVFNGLAVAPHLLDDLAGYVRLNLIQQLHRLDDAQHLAYFNGIPDLHKGRRTRRGRL